MSTERVFDLDARKAARAEKTGNQPGPLVRLGGKTYRLPVELPLTFLLTMADVQGGNMKNIRTLFDDLFKAKALEVVEKMTQADMEEFLQGLPEYYEISSGKLSDSPAS